MKKILVLIALSFMTVSTLTAQMKDPQNWVGYEEIMGVKNGLRFYDFDVNLIESSAPANVFWPGDDIRLKFQLINNTSQSIDIDAKVHVFRYGTKGIPNDIWLPQMIKLDYEKVIPVHLSILPNGYVNTSVSVDDIKDFGGYAVVFDLGKYGASIGYKFCL